MVAAAFATYLVLISAPTGYFASVDESGFCGIDMAGAVSSSSGSSKLQTAVSAYYLVYSSALSYWLPLVVGVVSRRRD